jgi:glycosyltransferase involved in cell wall biosynthesis
MRICLVYDCLFPWTVGGAERWTRNVAEALAARGHDVTYLTRRQWELGDEPDLPGIRVVAVSPPEALYGADGNRTIGQALRFGRGVAQHLAAHRGAYDVVHVSAAPYFGVLGAGLVRRLGGYRMAVDWHEVWSDGYWREYLGGVKGRVARTIQRLCVRIPQQAFCFSAMHAQRLREEGLKGEPIVLRGEWAGATERPDPRPAEPLVVFAGRMIPEKHAPDVVPAVMAARERIPGLRATIYGDGPQLGEVRAAIAAHGAEGIVDAPGFVDEDVVQDALARATCLLMPSTREGYGMIVIEAAAKGVPSVLVAAPDNASTEHIAEGVNGFVVADLSAPALADGIVAAHEGGAALREATADWFARHAHELSIATSLQRVVAAYGGGGAADGGADEPGGQTAPAPAGRS